MSDQDYAWRVLRNQRSTVWMSVALTALDLAVIGRGDVVVDYGCGPGAFTEMICARNPIKVVGFDPSTEMIDLARRVHGETSVRKYESSLGRLMVTSADVVFLNSVLGHAAEPRVTAASVWNCVRVGGRLVVTNPRRLYRLLRAPENALRGYRSDPTIRHRWWDRELVALFRSYGFRLVEKRMTGERYGGVASHVALAFDKEA